MSRYIDADALIDEFAWCKVQSAECNRNEWDEIITRVSKQPTVDAVPVRHAHFKYVTFFNGCTMDENLVCSECEQSVSGNENYCPNCGKRIEWESAE